MPQARLQTQVTMLTARVLSCTSEWKHVLLQYHKPWVFSRNNNKGHIPVFPEKFHSKVGKSHGPPLPESTYCSGGVHTVASLVFTRSCVSVHTTVPSRRFPGDFTPPRRSPSWRYCFTKDTYFRFSFFHLFKGSLLFEN